MQPKPFKAPAPHRVFRATDSPTHKRIAEAEEPDHRGQAFKHQRSKPPVTWPQLFPPEVQEDTEIEIAEEGGQLCNQQPQLPLSSIDGLNNIEPAVFQFCDYRSTARLQVVYPTCTSALLELSIIPNDRREAHTRQQGFKHQCPKLPCYAISRDGT